MSTYTYDIDKSVLTDKMIEDLKKSLLVDTSRDSSMWSSVDTTGGTAATLTTPGGPLTIGPGTGPTHWITPTIPTPEEALVVVTVERVEKLEKQNNELIFLVEKLMDRLEVAEAVNTDLNERLTFLEKNAIRSNKEQHEKVTRFLTKGTVVTKGP